MNKKLKLLVGSLSVALVATIGYKQFSTENNALSLEKERKTYSEFLKNSPYQETLKWDKKKRKHFGLPPNRYFEQMWELTINPSTGKLEQDGLNKLRNELVQKRQAQRSPGDSGNSWAERGPNNVGGRTRVIMFDPNDTSNNKVYAGGVSGGLWVNNNISSANSQWQRVENVPGNLSVTSITVDPRNSNIWYVGTGEQYTGGDVVGNGVYRTINGGTTWTALNIPAAGGGDINFNASNLFVSGIHYVNDVLAWDNGSSTELFVAVGAFRYGAAASPSNWLGLQSAGLYRSTDNGGTWNRIESANMRSERDGVSYYHIPNDLEVGADNRLWMGTINSALGEGGGKVYGSTNGATWTEAVASPLANANRVEIEPSATNGNKIYVLAQGSTSAAPVLIYKTTNGFNSVAATPLPNDADTGIAANDFTRGQAFYDLVIEADPNNDNIVYVGGIDLFKTSNGGNSWSQLSHWYGGFGQPNNVHADQHSIAFGNNSSSRMLFGNDGGVYYSGNAGGTIGARNKGYNVTQFVKAGIGPDGPGSSNLILTAGAQDNGTQAFKNASPGVNSSTELSDGDGFYTFVDKDGQYMIATYVNNVIYKFNLPWNGLGRRQGGSSGTLASDQATGDFVNQMGYDSNANRLLSNKSTASANAIMSINVAANNNGTLTNALLDAKPTAFLPSSFTNNRWFVGLANGKLVKLSNVNNSSATWAAINTPFVGAISSVRLGATENDIFVTIHNYGVTSVWATSNGGNDWTSKEGNLPNIPVRDILQNPLDRNEAILATQLGVWSTSNFNDTNPVWSQAYNGMSDVSVTSFDYYNVSGDNSENKIIASTYGRGVFTGSFTANAVADTEAPTIPSNLAASNVTDASLTLNWTVSIDNVGVVGYDVYRGTTKIGTATSNTYNVTGLNATTAYSFTVKAIDAAGNESAASPVLNITTPEVTISYCTSKGASVNDEYIQKVALGTISNTSTGGNGYSDFTSISTTLAKGSSNTITITPRWTGTTYDEGYGVFIDYNQDGDFSDAGETVYTKAPSKTTPVVGSFTVPTSATTGETRMRVVLKYNAIPTACEASFEYGEVEDYTVVIGGAQADTTAPSAPASLAASSVTQTTLTLNWSASTDNVAVTGYDVYQGATLLTSTAGTSTNITGLTAATAYTFSVRAKDAADNISAASNVVNVTTLSNQVSYCASKGNRSTYEWIDNVELGGMTNATAGNGGYGDFTSKVATLGQGSSNPMVISAAFASTAYTEHWAVWIDFNQDGTFADSEKVVSGSSSSANNLTATVAVPSNATLGQTRMRVSMKYNAAQTACETFADGEVEDYTVNIVGSTPNSGAIDSGISGEALGNEKSLNLMAYPNPAINNIQVKLASKSDNITYKIVNVIGRVVQRGRLDSSNINVSTLNTGMYILEVNDGQKSLTTKLMKK
ncbi:MULTISPECIES: GEVED domain-containing protein [unclassified Tenacibaculum]|uniref:GEVED domain-containing protein n=1 Tax=unclassified Tenacibaculum TaxID=2635139 RepID=UPI0021025360|nr:MULTISPECIES: GEVED domain-containing protein [unclassified Tenacibaculum]